MYSAQVPREAALFDESGELSKIGKVWLMQLGQFGHEDFSALRICLQTGRLHLNPSYFPNVIEITRLIEEARSIGRTHGFTSEPEAPADVSSSKGWRERMLADERARHPEWEKQPGESSNEYGLRMLKVMRGLSEEFDRNRMVTPE